MLYFLPSNFPVLLLHQVFFWNYCQDEKADPG
jgi:hypothetical protein